MSTIPLELPFRASEAAALADLVFQQVEGRPLKEDSRNRLAGRIGSLQLRSLTPYPGSLQQDPIHPSSYYIAVDAVSDCGPRPYLLRLALASSPASGFFPNAILIGRMRPGGGREIVVNAVPFGAEAEAVATFAAEIDKLFQPRNAGAQPGLTVVAGHAVPDAAFSAFRILFRATVSGVGSIAGETRPTLWAAIRAGWRDGYGLEGPLEGTRFVLEVKSDDTVESLLARNAEIRTRAKARSFDLALAPKRDPADAARWIQELKAEGRLVQIIDLPAEADGFDEWAAMARQAGAILRVDAMRPGLQEVVKAANGRINVRVDLSGRTADDLVELGREVWG